MSSKVIEQRKNIHAALLGAAFALLLIGTATAEHHESAGAAEFTADGELVRPAGWREWIFIGSPLTPNSMNGGEAAFPEFHSVYIDPESWAQWKETGTFREGTMIAKELTLVGATAATSGLGFFNGDLQGFEIAHKDSSRYGEDSDGWAYYTFGHKPEPYDDSTAAQPFAACAACHVAAAADDMVFAQYYPILRAAKSAGDAGAGTGGGE